MSHHTQFVLSFRLSLAICPFWVLLHVHTGLRILASHQPDFIAHYYFLIKFFFPFHSCSSFPAIMMLYFTDTFPEQTDLNLGNIIFTFIFLIMYMCLSMYRYVPMSSHQILRRQRCRAGKLSHKVGAET